MVCYFNVSIKIKKKVKKRVLYKKKCVHLQRFYVPIT